MAFRGVPMRKFISEDFRYRFLVVFYSENHKKLIFEIIGLEKFLN